MSKLVTGVKNIGRAVHKGLPHILTFFGIVGVGATAVSAAKATPKAMRDLQVATAEKQMNTGDSEAQLTPIEIIKVAGPDYAQTVAIGAATIGCIAGANHTAMSRVAEATVVATAYQQRFADLSAKVIEKVGKDKEQEIHDEIALDSMRRYPPKKGCVIETGNGDHLFYYIPHHVWFRSSYETIRRNVNEFNSLLLDEAQSENTWLDILYGGQDSRGEDYGFPQVSQDRREFIEIRFTEDHDVEGHPNPDYKPLYILNGEAATAVDLMPWCEPVYNYH